MDIDDLFSEANVVSTSDVARSANMPEAKARSWAEELGVAKIGNAFAWVRDDVEALVDQTGDADLQDDEAEDEEEESCDDDDPDDDEGEDDD